MHVRDYCDNVSAELTSWKVKMYDVMSKLEKVPSGDKEKLQPYLNDIHMILESLNDRIAQLRTECPVSWDPQKKEVDEVLGKIKTRWDEVSANIPWQQPIPAGIRFVCRPTIQSAEVILPSQTGSGIECK